MSKREQANAAGQECRRYRVGQLRSALLVALALPLLLGLARPAVEDAAAALQREYDACSDRTGYDPALAAELGPYELGAGERAWRACGYAAIESLMVPVTTIPDVYRELIETDRRLTDDVGAARITRAERTKQLTSLRAVIRAKEEIAQIDEEQAKQRDRDYLLQLRAAQSRIHELERDIRLFNRITLGRF